MSRPNSPWSMVGMLMGNPKLRSSSRKRKEKGKSDTAKSESPVPHAPGVLETQASEPVAGTRKLEKPVVVEEGPTSDAEGSLTDDQTYKVVARPATPDDHDLGWTNVDAQQRQPSPTSSPAPAHPSEPLPIEHDSVADEDIVDVLTQSVSSEFLQQQTEAHDTPSYAVLELQRKEAEINVLETATRDLHDRIRALENEVASSDLRKQELGDENRVQAQKLQQATASMQALEKELADVRNSEIQARTELEGEQRRSLHMEEEKRGQSESMRKMADDLEDVRLELENAQRLLEENAERARVFEEENHRVREDRFKSDEELTKVRRFGAETSTALEGALAEAGRARLELERVQRRLQETENRCEVGEGRIKSLQEDLDAERDELDELREHRQQATESLEEALTQVKALSQQNDELLKRMVRQDEELVREKDEVRGLRRTLEETVNQPNRRQLDVLERHNRMLMDQLRRQSERLSQNALSAGRPGRIPSEPSSRRDSISGIVVGMLDRLNSEIFQATAHMADSLDFSTPIDSNAPELKGVAERASVIMGKPMALAMRAISLQPGEFNPLPVQIGLQSCLVSCCMKIVTSWFPGHWDYGDFLAAIYLRIVETASPDNARKWRALTEHHLKAPSDSTVQKEMEGYLLKNVVDALTIAGWHTTQANAQHLLGRFHERLAQIAKLALRLNLVIRDGWEVMRVHSNDPFDEESMEDAYEGDDRTTVGGDYVVCTTDLGLKMGESIILKPKVVLRTMLTEETGYHSF
ncbi:hypothetical protein DXG03_008711 [Asterophora parasitica]|uniref:Uncharacterized protein n=1 Tax=Asterophora parasitica TaxID=117018 RepID=A0A9P7KB97_9AGAR|nr:hypothetical protein DXG03_008711 [Asterophora parasitica]